MDLILLQKVKNLGNLGDKVRVKPGYGRTKEDSMAFVTEENLTDLAEKRWASAMRSTSTAMASTDCWSWSNRCSIWSTFGNSRCGAFF